ncbi:MAG TPA: acyltransferase, partial [Candidatus Microbacterium pullistercoris]|nr:acyltransferase [Candidatus Microbacterium pullistercoris]
MKSVIKNDRTGASLLNLSGYRPDIDGMRSIAVIGVVLFHAGLTALPGGYVGVDVFFVISGYLITRQVLVGVQRGNFSFAEFYLRRARRLLPAGLFTIVGTLVAAVILLPPFRIAEIAQSAAAAAVSISNFFFWQESGYWAESSANQPLLHTWSLSVEEQFYLVWPLGIFLVLRFLPRLVVPLLLAGALLSVVVTAYFSVRSPDAAFYLTPFRAYEFAIGALCVWAEQLRWPAHTIGRAARQGMWLVGLAMIVFAMFTFDEESVVFPGTVALVPTLGTAFMILARRPDVLDGALSNPIMNYIGLRSYSIYLVHWPILVFTTELTGELTVVRAVLCVMATVVVAEVQYRVIERPLRIRGSHGNVSSLRTRIGRFSRLAVPTLASAVVICLVSVALVWANDRPEAYPEEVRAVVEMDHDAVNAERRTETTALCAEVRTGPFCGTFSDDAENVVVLGDSVAPEGYLLVNAIRPDVNILTAERAGCPPLRELAGITHSFANCEAVNKQRLRAIHTNADEIHAVVLALRLDEERLPGVVELVQEFEDDGIDVIVWGQGAHYEQSAWQTVAAHGRTGGVGEALYGTLDITAESNAKYAARIHEAGAEYVDRWEWMCGSSSCRAYVGASPKNLV